MRTFSFPAKNFWPSHQAPHTTEGAAILCWAQAILGGLQKTKSIGVVAFKKLSLHTLLGLVITECNGRGRVAVGGVGNTCRRASLILLCVCNVLTYFVFISFNSFYWSALQHICAAVHEAWLLMCHTLVPIRVSCRVLRVYMLEFTVQAHVWDYSGKAL